MHVLKAGGKKLLRLYSQTFCAKEDDWILHLFFLGGCFIFVVLFFGFVCLVGWFFGGFVVVLLLLVFLFVCLDVARGMKC